MYRNVLESLECIRIKELLASMDSQFYVHRVGIGHHNMLA